MGNVSSFRELLPRYRAAILVVAVVAVLFAGIGGAYALSGTSSVSVEENTLSTQSVGLELYKDDNLISGPITIPKISNDNSSKPSKTEFTISDYSLEAKVSPDSPKIYLRIYATFEDGTVWVGIDKLTITIHFSDSVYEFGTDPSHVPAGENLLSGAVSEPIEIDSNTRYDFTIAVNINPSAGYSEAYDFSTMSFVFKVGTSDPLSDSS